MVWDRTIRQSKGEGISTVQAAAGSIESGVWQAPVELKPAVLPAAPPAEEGAEGSGILREQRRLGMTLPEVAIDARGDAVATWTDTGPDSSAVQASTRPAEGTWQSPMNVSLPGEQPTEAKLAQDAQGHAVSVWYAGGVIAATTRQPSGSWQEPVAISAEDEEAGNDPQLAITPAATRLSPGKDRRHSGSTQPNHCRASLSASPASTKPAWRTHAFAWHGGPSGVGAWPTKYSARPPVCRQKGQRSTLTVGGSQGDHHS